MKSKSAHKSGFTLMEVVVFISIFSVSIIIVMSSISYAALQLNDTKYRIFATRYAEEIAEWLNYQREVNGYTAFAEKSGEERYCFNNLDIDIEDIDSWPSAEACLDYDLDNFYKRELLLSSGDNKVTAQITVFWRLLNFNKHIQITKDFYKYEF